MAESLQDRDHRHAWHPYASATKPPTVFPVARARGVRLELDDGRELVDGMSSWWAAIHGYSVPELDAAARAQLERMAHVMFGGLTHEPAVRLVERLVELTPEPLEKVFLSDSGSVSVEVAIKMALQFWQARGRPEKSKLAALRGGYHGDTFMAMSVCDPVTGMHSLFRDVLPQQHFVDKPRTAFGNELEPTDLDQLKSVLDRHADEIAALILEPVVQGAGGMWFYSPEYVSRAVSMCRNAGVLTIFDEVATGFGRTGKLFACEHASVSPDVLCLGKAMSGGYMTLAATLCTLDVAAGVSDGTPGLFMHGPTYMANPLACAVALASIDKLTASPWQQNVARIGQQLESELAPCASVRGVRDVRVLGAIGVVELNAPANLDRMQRAFVDRGVWIRPFGNLVYTMPAFVIGEDDLSSVTAAVVDVVRNEIG